MPDLTLDRGVRLIHIGPPKTGTTTIQGAFHQARDRLAEYGAVYAGTGRQPAWAALAVTARKAPVGDRPADMSDWTALVDEVAAAGDDQRVVVSSEFFADGDDDAASRVVAELGGSRAHVVVTLRPLTRIVVSQWQQYIQNGLRTPYEQWLEYMFDKPPYSTPTPSFWRRHRHDRLVERWASAVGADNVTVVIADESDPRMLVNTFESLLDLPSGLLVPEYELTNRSLTLGEAEVVRLLNVEFRRQGWPEAVYAKVLRYGGILQMKTAHKPLPGEPMIVTPRWAQEQAAAIGAEAAAKIEAAGVRIVGDVHWLGRVPDNAPASDEAPQPTLSAASAAQAILGAITASGALATSKPVRPRLKDRPIREVDARNLARVLVTRARRRISRMVAR